MKPVVVAIGGTMRPGSSTGRALGLALESAVAAGARTELFDGAFLTRLPLFDPVRHERNDDEAQLLEAVRQADGVILASPGYHGGVSALVKNALDLLEDLRDDDRPYLDGRAVGCIVTAAGWQSCGTTLSALRSIVHALRGWPTPLGVTLNSASQLFSADGRCMDDAGAGSLSILGAQVVEFAQHRHTVVAGSLH